MASAKGNAYYKLAKSLEPHKRNRYQPEELWEAALRYFDWIEKNPLKEEKVFSSGKRLNVSHMRAMTIVSFCVFAGISRETFDNYSKSDKYKPVTSLIRNIIFSQKFEGAAANLLNPSIIARELGLKEQADAEPFLELTAAFSLQPMLSECQTFASSENEVE
ncbi:MAG: terminase small subunit [Dysgonomonas sp.]